MKSGLRPPSGQALARLKSGAHFSRKSVGGAPCSPKTSRPAPPPGIAPKSTPAATKPQTKPQVCLVPLSICNSKHVTVYRNPTGCVDCVCGDGLHVVRVLTGRRCLLACAVGLLCYSFHCNVCFHAVYRVCCVSLGLCWLCAQIPVVVHRVSSPEVEDADSDDGFSHSSIDLEVDSDFKAVPPTQYDST